MRKGLSSYGTYLGHHTCICIGPFKQFVSRTKIKGVLCISKTHRVKASYIGFF